MSRSIKSLEIFYSGFVVLWVCTLLSACASSSFNDSVAVAPASIEVRKSPNDTRSYRYLTLPNKLRVLLVSDPDTEKSAAALAVYRGSFHEPKGRVGLSVTVWYANRRVSGMSAHFTGSAILMVSYL